MGGGGGGDEGAGAAGALVAAVEAPGGGGAADCWRSVPRGPDASRTRCLLLAVHTMLRWRGLPAAETKRVKVLVRWCALRQVMASGLGPVGGKVRAEMAALSGHHASLLKLAARQLAHAASKMGVRKARDMKAAAADPEAVAAAEAAAAAAAAGGGGGGGGGGGRKKKGAGKGAAQASRRRDAPSLTNERELRAMARMSAAVTARVEQLRGATDTSVPPPLLLPSTAAARAIPGGTRFPLFGRFRHESVEHLAGAAKVLTD